MCRLRSPSERRNRHHAVVRVPPILLVPNPIDPDAVIGLRSGGPEVGYRHRIGGEPSLAPIPWPTCPACLAEMTFYGQLDSVNDEVILADAGVLLTFVCFDCFEAVAQVASA